MPEPNHLKGPWPDTLMFASTVNCENCGRQGPSRKWLLTSAGKQRLRNTSQSCPTCWGPAEFKNQKWTPIDISRELEVAAVEEETEGDEVYG
jgi:hypothetical protein